MTLSELGQIAAAGESETVEIKKSTAQLSRAGETLCHHDYAIWGGAVNVAVFDDRVEIWSDGILPFGIRPDDLTREHASKPRDPDITNVFYRRGLIEQWGRGTNRIVELTVQAGHPQPEFEEMAGSVVVRFRPKSHTITPLGTKQVKGQPESQLTKPTQSATRSATQSGDPVERLLMVLQTGEKSPDQTRKALGIKHRPTFRKNYLHPAQQRGFIDATIPEKPQSRLQKYRLTEKGRAWLSGQKGPSL